MATAEREDEKNGQSKTWFVRNDRGDRFGPVDFETLKAWACDGRIGPANEISTDGADWQAAPSCLPLEMDSVAEITPGSFYGPIHRMAMRSLVEEGTISAQTAIFRRYNAEAERSAAEAADRDHQQRQTRDAQMRQSAADLENQVQTGRRQAEVQRKEIEELRQALASQQEEKHAEAERHARLQEIAGREKEAALQEVDRLRRALTTETEKSAESERQESQQQTEAERLKDRLRDAEQRLEAERNALSEIRAAFASQSEELGQIRRCEKTQAARADAAERRAGDVEAELLRVKEAAAAEAGRARDAVNGLQAKTDALERKLAQSAQERAETERQLAVSRADCLAQAGVWEETRRTLEMARQTLQAEVTRAVSETACQTERLVQMEKAAGEAARATERQRQDFERQLAVSRDEAAAARTAAETQRETARLAQAQASSLAESLTAAKDALETERACRHALDKALAETRQETEGLRDALSECRRRMEEQAQVFRFTEVAEPEVLDPEPVEKPKAKPQPELIEADVLPPSPAEKETSRGRRPASRPQAGRGVSGLSLAELELQARRELERLGAQGATFFARKR